MKKILLRLAAHEVLSKEEAEQVMLNMVMALLHRQLEQMDSEENHLFLRIRHK